MIDVVSTVIGAVMVFTGVVLTAGAGALIASTSAEGFRTGEPKAHRCAHEAALLFLIGAAIALAGLAL